MELDDATCHRACASRDRRFEGRFVIAVRTTGVYCRPGCPAPLPRLKNVRFYACPAAAEEAGFRPCLRCRPETAPGTPAWNGTSATVARALRLIGEGALDGSGIDALAGRLGVGARHLRRLFAEQLGASPLKVARTRRVHFARRLMEETRLPLSQVALGSGFGSIRSFNSAIRETFRRAPRDLRRATAREPVPDAAGLALHLPFRRPFDWEGALRFLAARAIAGVEAVNDGAYRRSIEIAGSAGTIEVRLASAARLALRVRVGATRELIGIVERVSRLFDLSADADRIASQLGRDPVLAPLLDARPGLRVPGAWDTFELAVRAVLGQQVSVRAASTLAGRLVRAFGRPLPAPRDGLTHLFPSPEALARADVASIGLPGARARALRDFAAAVHDGAVRFGAAVSLAEAVARFQGRPGFGPWTAHYVAMRALGEPDAFPAGDLGLRRALARGPRLPSVKEVEARAEAWRPWRAYAAMALWGGGAGTGKERR